MGIISVVYSFLGLQFLRLWGAVWETIRVQQVELVYKARNVRHDDANRVVGFGISRRFNEV